MVQDPAKCEPGIGGFGFFETYQGLLFGLIGITLQAKDSCQSRSSERALVPVKQNFVPPIRRRNVVFNHVFEAIPRSTRFTIEHQCRTDKMFGEKNEGMVSGSLRNL